MLKSLAPAFALAAGTAASVPAPAVNPQPDRAGNRADYAQIKTPDDFPADGDFSDFAANTAPVAGVRLAAGDDWEEHLGG